jgi:cytochrome P450
MDATGEHAVVSPFDPTFWSDPYRFYPALLAEPPRRESLLLPTVLVARHRDVISVLRDPARFSSRWPQLPFISKLDPFGGAPTLLFSDPPVHTRLRKLTMRYFRESTMEGLTLRVRATTDMLMDSIAARGEFDAVRDLAAPLPVAINAEILGLPPEDQPQLKTWSDDLFAAVRATLAVAGALLNGGDVASSSADLDHLAEVDRSIDAASANTLATLREYFIVQIERRRIDPGNDLLSALVSAHERGEMSLDEAVAGMVLLLFAGSETTTNLIANGLLALCQHPHERARIHSTPRALARAIEEVLRFDSPVQMVLRYASCDAEIDGVKVPCGAAVLVMLGAANRDPAQFAAPEHFDAARHPNQHVAFGEGIHACLGGQLARMQGQIAVGAMLERFPAFRLRDTEVPLEYSGSLLSRGLSRLPMATD